MFYQNVLHLKVSSCIHFYWTVTRCL